MRSAMWPGYPRSRANLTGCLLRRSTNTQRVLELFAKHQAKGTFFIVGWVAEKFPHLVHEIQSHGHEIACHSYWHRTVYRLSPDEFRLDALLAKKVIARPDSFLHNVAGR